jgi:hypothetical protein
MPRAVPSSPPELTFSDPEHVGEIPLSEIAPNDLIDTDLSTPGTFSHPATLSSQGSLRAPPAGSTRPAPPTPANQEISKAWAEHTHPSGTPLPPARPVAPLRDETAPIGLVPRIPASEIEELIEDVPTQQMPGAKPSRTTPAKQPLRATTPSVVVRETVPPRASSPRLAGERIFSEPRSIALTEPPPPPQVDPAWFLVARFIGVLTVIAAVAVSIGFWYLRAPIFELRDELARLRIEQAEARAQLRTQPEEPDAAVATEPDAAVATLPLDVVSVTTPDVVVEQVPIDVVVAAVDVRTVASAVRADVPHVSAPVGTVPGDAVRARLSGAMRSGINDCVEGVDEPRFVTVGVRYDGVTGSVTRVRLHGIFQEPPMGPCIEQVVRRVRAEPFTAPFWDVDFRFPVPQPRWRPPM